MYLTGQRRYKKPTAGGAALSFLRCATSISWECTTCYCRLWGNVFKRITRNKQAHVGGDLLEISTFRSTIASEMHHFNRILCLSEPVLIRIFWYTDVSWLFIFRYAFILNFNIKMIFRRKQESRKMVLYQKRHGLKNWGLIIETLNKDIVKYMKFWYILS